MTEQIKLSQEHSEYNWVNPQQAAKLLQAKYPSEFTRRIHQLS